MACEFMIPFKTKVLCFECFWISLFHLVAWSSGEEWFEASEGLVELCDLEEPPTTTDYASLAAEPAFRGGAGAPFAGGAAREPFSAVPSSAPFASDPLSERLTAADAFT